MVGEVAPVRLRAAARWSAELAALAAVALCVWVVASPLVAQGLPATDDSQDHLVRFAGFAMTLERGNLAPRWAGLLNVQYGSPIFSLYAPLSYYEGEAIHLMGATITDSLRWLYVAGLALSALAAYLFGRELAGRASGLVLAASYAALPYQLLDVYIRGALAEALALWLPPMALFGWARYVRTNRRRWAGLFGASIAGLTLTHNISAMIFLPLLLLCALGIAWTAPAPKAIDPGDGASRAPARESDGTPPGSREPAGDARVRGRATDRSGRGASRDGSLARRRLADMAVAGGLGVGLAAFFWLPALAGRGLVQSERMTADFLDVHRYLTASWPAIQTSFAATYRHDAQRFAVLPGLVQVLIAIAGGAALAFASARAPCHRRLLWLLPLALAGVALLALQRPESAPLWDRVPLARYVQFPYRLLGPFGLITAMLACCVPLVARGSLIQWAIALGACALTLTASTAALPRVIPAGLPEVFDARSLLETEAAMGELAATSASEYTPATVLASTRQVIQTVTGSPRLSGSPAIVPATATLAREGDTDVEVAVATPRRATLVLRRFFSPGWAAALDGRALAVRPAGDLGLLSVDLPPGSGVLSLAYRPSRVDVAARWLAVASAGALAAWCAWGRHGIVLRILAPASVLVAMAALAVAARAPAPAAPYISTGAVELAPGYALEAARVDTAPLASQSLVRVWLSIFTRQSGRDLIFRARAVDRGGTLVADLRARPWNGSTAPWVAGEVAPAALDVPLPGGAPASSVALTVTAYDASQPDVALGSATLPAVPVDATPPRPYRRLGDRFADTLGIVAYRLSTDEQSGRVALRPGQALDVILDLQSLRWMGEDQSVFVHLLDPQGRLRAQYDDLAGGRQHPTSTWVSGEIVRQRFPIVVPADAPPGDYRLEAGFYQLATMGRLALLDAAGKPLGDSLLFGDLVVQAGGR